jgi:polar amino acid transport system substrate-binding protein
MRKIKSSILSGILIFVLALSVIAFSGCVEEDENKVIIGTSADFPPFEYLDDDGNIIGFDIDMTKGILENLGYNVEVKDITFDSLIPSLQTGKIDVIAAAMTITSEREEQVDFTNPYYEADQSVLVVDSSTFELNNTIDLQNYTVGSQTGTTGAAWVEEHLVENGSMSEQNFSRYDTYTLAVLDLINENIDAVVLDKPVAEAFVANRDVKIIDTIITGESYGLAVEQGNTDLLAELNQGLSDLIGSQEWTNLVSTYFE